jgi:hypothetical protein
LRTRTVDPGERSRVRLSPTAIQSLPLGHHSTNEAVGVARRYGKNWRRSVSGQCQAGASWSCRTFLVCGLLPGNGASLVG